jgi:arginine/lysine/histidine transport system permease protein
MIDFSTIKQLFFTFRILLFLFIKAMIPFIIAAGTSLYIALCSYITSIIIGCFFGLLLASKYKTIWFLPFIITRVIRCIPVLMYILFLYYGLPQFGIQWGALKASMVAFMITSSADIADIVYRGIVTIPKGQIEASHTLGLSMIQIKLYIILPQAALTMATELANQCIVLIKQSSITSIIGVHEVTSEATSIFCNSYDAVTPLLLAAVTYVLLTLLFTFLLSQLHLYYYVPR